MMPRWEGQQQYFLVAPRRTGTIQHPLRKWIESAKLSKIAYLSLGISNFFRMGYTYLTPSCNIFLPCQNNSFTASSLWNSLHQIMWVTLTVFLTMWPRWSLSFPEGSTWARRWRGISTTWKKESCDCTFPTSPSWNDKDWTKTATSTLHSKDSFTNPQHLRNTSMHKRFQDVRKAVINIWSATNRLWCSSVQFDRLAYSLPLLLYLCNSRLCK